MVRVVVDFGLSKAAAARRFHTTPKTVAKWIDRFQAEGVEGLRDRSSRPLSSPSRTTPADCAAVETLRRQRHTGEQIAGEVGVSAATVSRILKRLGLTGCRRSSRPSRFAAMNEPRQARSSTSTSRARQIQSDRPPDHRRQDWPEQRPRGRLGIRASGDRRPFPPRLLGNPAGREANVLPALSLQRPALLSKPRRQGPARHDGQWRQLQLLPIRQGAAPA